MHFDKPGRRLVNPKFTSARYVYAKSVLAKESLARMAKQINESGGAGSTLAFDLGTIDNVHFLNFMVLHPCLDAAYLLSAVRVVGPATAAVIAEHIEQAILKFNDLRCGILVALCTDNASNVTLASKLVIAKHPHMIHFSCGCHVMNLVSERFDADNAFTLSHDTQKQLQAMGLLRTWCATRWWSKHEAFRKLTLKSITPEHRREVAGLNGIVQQMTDYVSATAPLRAAGRSLERDSAHMPLATCRSLKCAETPALRPYVMDRFIKFYASVGPMIVALISPNANVALDEWDCDQWTGRIT